MGDGHVYYLGCLDCGDGNMGMCGCPESSKCKFNELLLKTLPMKGGKPRDSQLITVEIDVAILFLPLC